jgi:transposase InsO family protein
MPWKVSDPMSERLKFVSRYLDGEKMTDLCTEFEISRKTGYKLVQRYEEAGASAFWDQSRAPKCHPNQTPPLVEKAIVDLRQQHPTWGAPMIRAYLERKKVKAPATSTIHAILQRHDLVTAKRRRAGVARAKGTHLVKPDRPNGLWCTDFKGQFRLGNGIYCYPLTVTDQKSRFLLACEGFESIDEQQCIQAFHRLFGEFGLPDAIRSDNGVPFASRSYFGLSKLSVFWVRLGISLERIEPGCPQQNGCHERMHRTLKADATKPASSNLLAQQERFDAFRSIFNRERPHQALDMASPEQHYSASTRAYDPHLEPLRYPDHDLTTRITKCGQIFVDSRKLKLKAFVGIPFGGYGVGLKSLGDGTWQVNFMDYLLGYIDGQTRKLQIPANPFLKERHPLV